MIRSVNLSSDQFALISVVLSCVPVYGELLQGTDVLPPAAGTAASGDGVRTKDHRTKDHWKCQPRTKRHSHKRPPGQKTTIVEIL